MPDLVDLVDSRHDDLQALVDELNKDWLPAVVTRYNSEFGPRYFGRPPSEKVPTEKRLLTTFRTRLGGLLEYGLGVTWDRILSDAYGHHLRLSFAVAHEYPDFYLRNADGEILLRIDAKLLHDESVEYSARFTLPISEIDPGTDLLWYAAWQWRIERSFGFVYPHVLETLMVPSVSIAAERDLRLELTGGHLEDGVPLVPPAFNVDTNYGKINRIVHQSRKSSDDLDSNVRAFLAFQARHAEAVERASGEVEQAVPTSDELDPQAEDDESVPSTS